MAGWWHGRAFPPDYDRRSGYAWVTEQRGISPDDSFGNDDTFHTGGRFDPYAGDGYTASARFHVHVESEALPDGYIELHDWAELSDALELARGRAVRFIVRTADNDEYSAGETPLDDPDGQLLPWPANGLDLQPRRLADWGFLDRTDDDDPISWDGLACGDVVAQPHGFEQAFLRALDASNEMVVGRVRVLPFDEPEPGEYFSVSGESLNVELTTTRATRIEAVELAIAVCTGASNVALAELGVPPGPTLVSWNAAAFPTGSKVAAQHARMGPLRN